jgi:very-short-patch-repair endonuclease
VSDLEETLAFQIKAAKFPEPRREGKFHPTRTWRFDFSWPNRMLAVEVEGGTWQKSRHTTGSGFEKDCEKYNEAVMLGWKVLRVTKTMVEDGRALAYIERALK